MEDFLKQAKQCVGSDDWQGLQALVEAVEAEHQNDATVLFCKALALLENDFPFEASQELLGAIDHDLAVGEHFDLLSIIYAKAGKLNEAIFNGKMVGVYDENTNLRELIPQSLGSLASNLKNINEDTYFEKGIASLPNGNYATALHWLRQYVNFHPYQAKGHLAIANILTHQGEANAAANALRAARHLIPDNMEICALLADYLSAVGDFSNSLVLYKEVEAAGGDRACLAGAKTLSVMLQNDAASWSDIEKAALSWGKTYGYTPEFQLPPLRAYEKERLNIGYQLGGILRASRRDAIADVLVAHDPQKVRVIGFGYGELSAPQNIQYQKCVDVWHNVEQMDAVTFGSIVSAEGVDILVDAAGFSNPELLTAFGYEMAPIQVSWFDAPSGTGLASMNYQLSDAHIDAEADKALATGERLYLLENGLPIFDTSSLNVAPKVEKAPDAEVTFISDASFEYLTSSTVSLWAKVLRENKNSKLLLLDQGFSEEQNISKLISLFGNYGVSHKIDVLQFAGPESLYSEGDIFLMAPTASTADSAIAALRCGIPVVALTGLNRASRFASSGIAHSGLAESCLAKDAVDYCAKVRAFAESASCRVEFASKAQEALQSSELLNSKKRAQDLEKAYAWMWQEAVKQ